MNAIEQLEVALKEYFKQSECDGEILEDAIDDARIAFDKEIDNQCNENPIK
jgi:hypothetical protein